MPTISRAFLEIGVVTKDFDAGMKALIASAEASGGKLSKTGERMVVNFQNALNPTKALATNIADLERAGMKGSDIWQIYGDKMKAAADAALKHGQAVDPLIAKHLELNKAAESSGLHFQNLGQSLQNFASNPLMAVQSGIMSVVTTLGPLGIGLAAVGITAGLAGKGLFDFIDSASKDVEHLENLSIQTGVATKDLQALGQIAKNAGMESIDLGRSIGRLNAELGKGKGDYVDALKALKIPMKDASGAARDGVVLMSELGEKLKGMGSSADIAQKGAAALGPRLTQLLPLLVQGTESLKDQMDAMEGIGLAYDAVSKESLLRFHNAMNAVDTIMAAAKIQTVSFLAELINSPKAMSGFAAVLVSPVTSMYLLTTALAEGKVKLIEWALATATFLHDKSGIARLTPALAEARASMDAWSKKLVGVMEMINKVGQSASTDGSKIKTEWTPGLDEAAKAAARLREETEKIIHPMDVLAQTIDKQIKLGFSKDVLINAYSKKILEASDAQVTLGGSLTASESEMHGLAIAMQGMKDRAAAGSGTIRIMASDLEKLSAGASNSAFSLVAINEELNKLEAKKREQASELDQFIPKQPKLEDISGFKEIEKAAEEHQARMLRTKESFRDILSANVYTAQLAAIKNYYKQIEELKAEGFISDQQYANAKKNLTQEENDAKLARYRDYFGNLSQIQSSQIRSIAAIGKAAAIAQATINTYEGATKALAEGGIWGAVDMAAVMAIGFAQVAAIASQGFKDGGLITGGERIIKVNEQGPEFMVNADATKEYLPLLQMLNSGRAVGSQMDSGPSLGGWSKPSLNISIANYGSGKQFDVEHLDENTVRIIARDEAFGVLSRRGPEVIANDMAYANSKTSKAVARHTTARRGDR
jgi:hypothetical protein